MIKRMFTIFLVLSILIGLFPKYSSANSVRRAYALKSIKVLNSKGHKVAKIRKGTTFRYLTEARGFLKFKYYGKIRYASTQNLITNSNLEDFVKTHTSLFDLIVRTTKKHKVYCKPSSKSKVLRRVSCGDFKIFSKKGSWYKVQLDGDFGYVTGSDCKLLCLVDVTVFPSIVGSSLGEKICNYAKKFVGNPYVWGGTSLTTGADCSGFVSSVYKQFGFNLPRCSYEQATVGKTINFNKLQPGDLIFYKRGSRIGHVTLYIGDGKVVQARGAAYGIVITDWDYSTPCLAKRII